MKSTMRRLSLLVISVSLLLCAPISVHAAKTVKMPAIRMAQDYAKAQEILKLVNKERNRKKQHKEQ